MKLACSSIMLLLVLMISGCADKAEPKYAECVKLDATGDTMGAWRACQDSVTADPNSKSGKAAAEKLAALKPKHDALKKEQDEQRARAAEAASKAEAARREEAARATAARLAQLKAKISRRYWDTEPSGVCTGKGMPPYMWDYTGGTFDENREIARSEGCQSPYSSHENTTFCCPKAPGGF